MADEAAAWEALGFTVLDDVVWLGGVAVRLAGREAGEGIVGWRVRDLAPGDLDGLPTEAPADADPAAVPEVAHPNGAVALDHVVALTGDLDHSIATLARAGLEPRRVRDVPGSEVRQAFYVLGPALLELAGPVPGQLGATFWGLVVVVDDLDALAERLGDRLGAPRDALQRGRRIATLRPEAGSSTSVAFMTPR